MIDGQPATKPPSSPSSPTSNPPIHEQQTRNRRFPLGQRVDASLRPHQSHDPQRHVLHGPLGPPHLRAPRLGLRQFHYRRRDAPSARSVLLIHFPPVRPGTNKEIKTHERLELRQVRAPSPSPSPWILHHTATTRSRSLNPEFHKLIAESAAERERIQKSIAARQLKEEVVRITSRNFTLGKSR
jgi:hypothetical protein